MKKGIIAIVAVAAMVCGGACTKKAPVITKVCELEQFDTLLWTQGMDIVGDYLVNCHNTGYAKVYKFDGANVEKLGEFPLATNDPVNHSNVASFGKEYAVEGDPLPVIYISQCAKKPYKGHKDVLFVERIAPDFQSSELVQTIFYDDVEKDFGYALQWVLDENGEFLYGYGNTTKDKDVENNRHRIIKFRMPALSDGEFVTLTKADALENYLIEDTAEGFATIGQGLYIRENRLYMPTGVGTEKYPATLYVWNLQTRQMERILDMNYTQMGEPEDMSWYNGNFYVSAVKGLFKIENL